MNMTSKLFFVCLCCFALTLLSGCGGVKLTPAEQAEVDRYIKEYGRDSMLHYFRDTNEPTLKYVKYLVSQGANVNATDERNDTLLQMAIKCENPEIVRFLVSKGANVNPNISQSPLNLATRLGNVEIVKFLVSKGADVNAYGTLSAAVDSQNIELVKFLASKGADVNNGALSNAVRWKNIEIVKFLVSKGADVNDGALSQAAENQDTEIADFLISKGADVNGRGHNNYGWTPLYAAVASNFSSGSDKLEFIKFLVSKGADVNTTINAIDVRDDGDSPLHRAAEKGDLEVVKFLVSKGANVNAKMGNGNTPLDEAESKAVWLNAMGAREEIRDRYKAVIDYLSGLK